MLIRNGEKVESEFETAASKNVKPWARARGGGGTPPIMFIVIARPGLNLTLNTAKCLVDILSVYNCLVSSSIWMDGYDITYLAINKVCITGSLRY